MCCRCCVLDFVVTSTKLVWILLFIFQVVGWGGGTEANWERLKAVSPCEGDVFSFQHRWINCVCGKLSIVKNCLIVSSISLVCSIRNLCAERRVKWEKFFFRSDWNLNHLLWIPLESTASITIKKRIPTGLPSSGKKTNPDNRCGSPIRFGY